MARSRYTTGKLGRRPFDALTVRIAQRCGRTTANRAPCGAADSTAMLPPSDSTIRFASARPSPEPSLVRAASPRQNGSNTRSAASASDPLSGVLDRELDRGAVVAGANEDRAVLGRMADRVLKQVLQHASQPRRALGAGGVAELGAQPKPLDRRLAVACGDRPADHLLDPGQLALSLDRTRVESGRTRTGRRPAAPATRPRRPSGRRSGEPVAGSATTRSAIASAIACRSASGVRRSCETATIRSRRWASIVRSRRCASPRRCAIASKVAPRRSSSRPPPTSSGPGRRGRRRPSARAASEIRSIASADARPAARPLPIATAVA